MTEIDNNETVEEQSIEERASAIMDKVKYAIEIQLDSNYSIYYFTDKHPNPLGDGGQSKFNDLIEEVEVELFAAYYLFSITQIGDKNRKRYKELVIEQLEKELE